HDEVGLGRLRERQRAESAERSGRGLLIRQAGDVVRAAIAMAEHDDALTHLAQRRDDDVGEAVAVRSPYAGFGGPHPFALATGEHGAEQSRHGRSSLYRERALSRDKVSMRASYPLPSSAESARL